MSRVSVWVYDGQIQIDHPNRKPGDPCLQIPATKEAVWEWINTLMMGIEDGDIDAELPGRFLEISEEA